MAAKMAKSKPPYLLKTLPDKVLCSILKHLDQPELLKCRFVSKNWNTMITSHFILNATLSDTNISRLWSSGVKLPWRSRAELKSKTEPAVNDADVIFNRIKYLTVGDLRKKLPVSLVLVSRTVKEIEFTQPATEKNICQVVKECWECDVLRFHTTVFFGIEQKCRRKKPKFATIKLEANQLRKVIMVMDNTTRKEGSDCTVPFRLKINLSPPMEPNRYKICEVHILPEGQHEESIEIFKTWTVNDDIIDIFSRPDCLRKLTYFANVEQAELRKIEISYMNHLYIPGTVKYTNVIHQPVFYPLLKNYPCGPFNGTILTYVSTNRKQIMTYKPIHITAEVLLMNFPDATLVLLANSSS